VYCFIYLLELLISGRCCLDASIFDNLQDLEVKEFKQQVEEEGKYP
jgi:hypothetical protein